jgi:osmoprotectant transport system permease protein
MTRALSAVLLLAPALALGEPAIQVGSKRFTESYLLGEILAQAINATGRASAAHRPGLGNTAVLFAALKNGAIHVYPEYTGTIALELLGLGRPADLEALNRGLARHGVRAGVPLGFDNAYVLAMTEERAAALGVRTISDLARHPGLRLGLSHEFLNRRDGWPALQRAYRLPFSPSGLDHGLAYEALAAGQTDVIDAYTTDPKVRRYRLRVLVDDLGFFPAYEAVLLYRSDFPERFPEAWRALQALQGSIGAEEMLAMNAAVELGGASFARVAAEFLARRGGAETVPAGGDSRTFLSVLFGPDFWRLTGEHLLLVFVSLALSAAVGIPLGVWAERRRRARAWILGAVGVLQTVPALALLAFLIAALGRIGTVPAMLALFLYALLPIVRNTEAGLAAIAPGLKDSATALGMRPRMRLRLIELPLAARTILAGVKTAAVINVGTATIAAFVGAGGYGERIVAGLAVNDPVLLLAGAVPAAAMAIGVELAFGGLERILVSPGLAPSPGEGAAPPGGARRR